MKDFTKKLYRKTYERLGWRKTNDFSELYKAIFRTEFYFIRFKYPKMQKNLILNYNYNYTF